MAIDVAMHHTLPGSHHAASTSMLSNRLGLPFCASGDFETNCSCKRKATLLFQASPFEYVDSKFSRRFGGVLAISSCLLEVRTRLSKINPTSNNIQNQRDLVF